MTGIVKIPFQGKVREARRVEINQTAEHWNQYQLEDGSTIRIKSVVTDVFRIPDAYDADGNPIYMVKTGNIMSVASPEELRKKS